MGQFCLSIPGQDWMKRGRRNPLWDPPSAFLPLRRPHYLKINAVIVANIPCSDSACVRMWQ